jgi:hypothetical protein
MWQKIIYLFISKSGDFLQKVVNLSMKEVDS